MPALRERVGILGFAAGQALRGVDHQGANLRTHLERIIVRAGHKVWPRLFPNLGASCATDLLTAVENGGAGRSKTEAMRAKTDESPRIKSKMDDVAEAVGRGLETPGHACPPQPGCPGGRLCFDSKKTQPGRERPLSDPRPKSSRGADRSITQASGR